MGESLRMTNGSLQRMYAALAVLGNRRMASLAADLKVARLLRVLAPHVEPLETLKRGIVLDLAAGLPKDAALSNTREQLLVMTIGARQAELDAETVEIDLPIVYALRETDLPKEMTGADGWKNSSQLGAIVADLGPLYNLDEV